MNSKEYLTKLFREKDKQKIKENTRRLERLPAETIGLMVDKSYKFPYGYKLHEVNDVYVYEDPTPDPDLPPAS